MTSTPSPTFETVDAALIALEETLSSSQVVGQGAIETIRAALSFLEMNKETIGLEQGQDIERRLGSLVMRGRTLLTLALQGQPNAQGIEGTLRFSRFLASLHGARP